MDNAGSADLQWFLLRGWNSKVVKRGSAGFMFSSESGNLKNKHSPRYSGLVHPKPMAVTPAPSGGVLITTRKASANRWSLFLPTTYNWYSSQSSNVH
ncbi:hypothetical protein PGT21_002346 [Puccinia graminis f. sp. tritici]|uniref:Ribosomal eL28/Mak16 domain-containing protein n=1 Tax=Puccinia graminis f. sp. tritici TaxID=56615 RepID=A0A5B0LY92_PUCGR|nr:hypothetical protein PGT21_002346 [Puccinia graminis f. sp. tritici]